MNMVDQARLKMQQRVEAYLLRHTDITDTLPNFAGLFALFRAGIVEVLELMKKQISNPDTALQSKSVVRASLEALLLDVIGKLAAYANNKPVPELLPKVKITKTEVKTCSDNVLVSHSKTLSEIITSHQTELEAYRIKPEVVENLGKLNDLLVKQEALPEVETKDQDQDTKAITIKLRDNQKVLKKIDIELLIVEYSDVVFHDEYLNLRKIVMTGKHSLAIQGKVIHKVTRKGLKGVSILIEGADEATVAVLKAYTGGNRRKKTAKMGGFNKKSFIEGTLKITASMIGFADQTVTVYARSGETTRVLIELEPV